MEPDNPMLPMRKMEYGDFQTPVDLAQACCRVLAKLGIRPSCVLEPTCGTGTFLQAAIHRFPDVKQAAGIEINSQYAAEARRSVNGISIPVSIETADIFRIDFDSLFERLYDPLLVIGNPPWVTNSALGQMASGNLPCKRRADQVSGIEAITGKSNFDISEWILVRLLDCMNGRTGVIAMLCKTTVARKVLQYAWSRGIQIAGAYQYAIDAQEHFQAAVEACFLVIRLSPGSPSRECAVSPSFATEPSHTIGYRGGQIVADVDEYDRYSHLRGASAYRWRSGVKHDCVKVMEFRVDSGRLRNGLNEIVDIEDTCLYPMFKGSDVGTGKVAATNRFMLVPQKRVGDDTSVLRKTAPRTWAYLERHRRYFDSRGSTIYAQRPPFSIFGVGDYAFAPWKVAIAALYKKFRFRVIGPAMGRPSMVDDTVYFLACQSRQEAESLAAMLHSPSATKFLNSLVFWDSKRPITVSLLSRLAIERLAEELVDCST